MRELFKDDDLAYDVWVSKYRFKDESKDEFFERLTKPFLREFRFHEDLSEYGKHRTKRNYLDIVRTLIEDFQYIVFGGSGLSGIGTGKPVSISNCYVLKSGDSISEIFDTSKNMANIYKRRGGVGTDLSSLRPRGAHVNNAAKTTSGVVPFMELYSQTTNTIGQDGRRGALMISLDVRHPDSPEFATAKRDLTKITGANVSLKVEADFIKAVENDEDYLLRWPVDKTFDQEYPTTFEYNKLTLVKHADGTSTYVKRVKAKELWDTIIESNWMSAEPGILFWDNIIDNDPASVYEEFRAISTNPCGEIPLSDKDACRLLATNVYSVISAPFTKNACIDETLAYEVFYEALVMNDTIVDIELEHIKRIMEVDDDPDFWQEIYNVGQNGRRTGAGLTGLGDMYAALGVPYGHPATTEKLMKIKIKAELEASIDLAINDGPFPAYNRDLEFTNNLMDGRKGKNDFYQMLLEEFPEQVKKMWQYGRRNISWSTVAPTGSISLLTQTTSGCEPLFSPYYMRRKKVNANDENQRVDFTDDVGIDWQEYPVLHTKFKLWIENNLEDGTNYDDHTWNSQDLDAAFANSPWFGNTANDLTPEQRIECQSILQRYTTHSISSTVNLPNDVTQETINELYVLASKKGLKGLTTYRDGSRQGVLVSGKVDPVKVEERPEQIDCKVIRFKNEKKNWVAFVGLVNNKPYEIFTGINELDAFPIPTYVEEGTIIKVSTPEGSRYDFRYKDSYDYVNTLGGLNRIFKKEFWNYARLTSAILRENVEIQDVIKILGKLEFSDKSMNTWQAGIIRALSPFVKDGIDSKEICPDCEQDSLVYQEGCLTCRNCGFSKCG